MPAAKALRHQDLDYLPKQFRPAVAEDALRFPIDENDASFLVSDDQRKGGVLNERLELPPTLQQLLLRPAAGTPRLRVAQLALDGRDKSRQIAFEEVVVRAGFHGRHYDFLADGARHNNEGQVKPA